MDNFLKDLRFAIRTMAKRPGFTFVALFTLALGIGANTAIFTVVEASLLRSLPYRDPDRLLHLFEKTPQKDFNQREASYPDFLDWRNNQTFEGLAAYTGGGFTLGGRETVERLSGGRVSANFFAVIGVNASIGRTFEEGEDREGAERVVLLTHALWQRLFGGDPAALNQMLTLNDQGYRIVGVLPANFQFAPRGSAELWTPLIPNQAQRERRFMHWANIVGRLKQGVTVEQAQSEMSVIAKRIEEQFADSHAGTSIIFVPLHEQIIGSVKPLLIVLLGSVSFVLLIACANVANLLLARSSVRQKEIAIRIALGASRGRLVRQLLTESVMLALAGGALGLVIAGWGVDALISVIPQFQLSRMPYLRGLAINPMVLAFTFGLSLVTGIVFGLVPALQSTRPDLHESLKEGGKTSAGAMRHRVRSALIVSEIALALVLLAGAGLMMKSLWRLLHVNPGFDTENLLTMSVSLPASKYDNYEKVAVFHKESLSRLETLPGIKGAATVGVTPLTGGNTTRFFAEGQPRPAAGEEVESNLRDVSANYFRVMGIPLIAGREFDDRDMADAPGALIVNQTLAERVFPGESAVGRRLIFTNDLQTPVEIVGVVGDEKLNGLDAKITPVVYYPFLQDSDPGTMTNLVVRTDSDPNNLINAVTNECRRIEPGLTTFAIRTVEQIITDSPSTFTRRFPALLIGVFASVALLLATVGIYGVISYSVSQQSREIGIRLALGASRRDILRLVMGHGGLLAAGGLGAGLGATIAVSRFLESLLFEVSPTDPMILVIISSALALVALIACYIPARRATKTDPMVALRYE